MSKLSPPAGPCHHNPSSITQENTAVTTRPWQHYFVASSLLRTLVVAVCLTTAATQQTEGDDISNNLFTDLGPILALFGEQVAKQFMAASLGWSDIILFAMAPLGVITAIVGAIRIGGPVWLLALIGRARENRAAAEMELTTSTSADVCELWNGQAVVRMPGAPNVLELLFFPHQPNNSRLFTVHSATQHGILEETKQHSWGSSYALGSQYREAKNIPQEKVNLPDTASDPEAQSVISTSSNGASKRLTVDETPNMALNMSPKRNDRELRLFAAFAVFLQAAALVYPGFGSYVPSINKRIGMDSSMAYGYPFVLGGTLLLVLGMLICSFIIEISTQETHWSIVKRPVRPPADKTNSQLEGKGGFRIAWLQQGENINDQQFESYAVFPESERTFIWRSRIRETDDTDRHDSRAILSTQTLVVVGTIVSIVGFVIQFVGIRGMHWSISVAQLVATLVMAAIRAFVRRDMAQTPRSQSIPRTHELDWLATRLFGDWDKLWADLDDGLVQNSDPSIWSHECHKWGIVTASHTSDYTMEDTEVAWKDSNRADTVVKIRERLGRLSRWTVPASKTAVAVATAIDIVASRFLENSSNSRELRWTMRGLSGEMIYLSLRRDGDGWKASAPEIDALLSLWLYASQESSKPVSDESVNNLTPEDDADDWLKEEQETLRKPNLRLLGAAEPGTYYEQCIRWYMEGSRSLKRVAEYFPEDEEDDGCKGGAENDVSHEDGSYAQSIRPREISIPPIDNERVTGFISLNPDDDDELISEKHFGSQHTRQRTQRYFRLQPADSEKWVYAKVSYAPIHVLYAQDIFAAFMWCVAKKVELSQLQETVITNPDVDLCENLRLLHPEVNEVVRDIMLSAGKALGIEEDIEQSVYPPLMLHRKLPEPLSIIGWAKKTTTGHENLGRWSEAVVLYEGLIRGSISIGRRTRIAVEAAALVFDFHRRLTFEWKSREAQFVDLRDIDFDVFDIKRILDTIDAEILEPFHTLIGIQETSQVPNEWPDGENQKKQAFERGWDDVGALPVHYTLYDELCSAKPTEKKFSRHFMRGVPKEALSTGDFLGWTPLHYLSRYGIGHAVRNLLDHHPGGVDDKDISGRTPLHFAAMSGDENTCWELLVRRPELDARDSHGFTALHHAAMTGNKAIVHLLLGVGASPDVLDHTRKTPLHWACFYGHVGVIITLIDQGARIAARDDNGRTPLLLYCLNTNEEYNTVILDQITDKNSRVSDADKDGRTALHLARHAELVQKIVSLKDTDLNPRDGNGNTPLHLAAELGLGEKARILCQAGADIEARNRNDETPLLTASKIARNVEPIKSLIEAKANIEATSDASIGNNTGATPLLEAVNRGNVEGVRLLVEAGANVHATNAYKVTALHFVMAYAGRMDELDGDFIEDEKEGEEWKQNHEAEHYAQTEILRFLVERGVNVNARDHKGLTPLHYAVKNGLQRFLGPLIKAGADEKIADNLGKTAMTMAMGTELEKELCGIVAKRDIA